MDETPAKPTYSMRQRVFHWGGALFIALIGAILGTFLTLVTNHLWHDHQQAHLDHDQLQAVVNFLNTLRPAPLPEKPAPTK